MPRSRRTSILLALAMGTLLFPSAATWSQMGEHAAFCSALERINRGEVDTTGLTELQGHARVADELLEVAPAPIAADVTVLHRTVEAWALSTTGEVPMLQTFALLSDPEFAGVQGRIADYIAEHCGLRLGDGKYHVGAHAVRIGRCPAWPRVGSPLTFNHFPNLPDISGANYFANDFWLAPSAPPRPGMFVLEPGGWVEFRGQYPRARYFAHHPNDEDLNNLPTLRDRDLEPDPGRVNPFREVPPPGSRNTYTAKLVNGVPPAKPDRNTTYVGVRKDGVTPNRSLTNLLRLYASDVGDGPNSGGVPLPAVTIHAADGSVKQQFPECDPYVAGEAPPRTDLIFPVLPIADHRARKPATWNTSSNFDAPSDTLANADVQYLSTYYSRRFGDILLVRGKYLSAPDSRGGEPVSTQRDIRLWTLCTYNFWAGSAIHCMLDNEVRRDAAGFYTIVVSDAANRPANLEAQGATWIDAGPYLDGQLTWRMVFRENAIASAVAAVLDGGSPSGEIAPYVPAAMPCTRARFEAAGWEGCFEYNHVDAQAHR